MQYHLKDSLELVKRVLGSDLLGVYLYGSALVGGLQKYSDLDLLVATNRTTTLKEKSRLVAKLLQISGIYMKSSKFPLEMTLVEKTAVNTWSIPLFLIFNMGSGYVPLLKKA